MKKLFSSLMAILLLSGCNPSDSKLISIGETEFTPHLKDPESVKYKEVFFKQDTEQPASGISGYVCGLMNARNGFGGYSGFKPFYIHVTAEPRFLLSFLGVKYYTSDVGYLKESDSFDEIQSRCAQMSEK